jgi:hypothetical protein
MTVLEIIALVAFIIFVLGAISLCVTSILKLINNSRVVDLLLMASIWVYGISGFITILLSLICELIK